MGNSKIHLIIASGSGDLEEDFNQNEKIRAIKVSSMAKLHIDPSQAEKFVLALNGRQLDEEKTLVEEGVPTGATLVLEPKEAIKI